MPSIQKTIVTSILNFADSAIDVYMLFVKNKQGLRKLSTDAKAKAMQHLKLMYEQYAAQGDLAADPVPSVNGDCVLYKVSRDRGASTSGVLNTLEADSFNGLINGFGATGKMNIYETSSSQDDVDLSSSSGSEAEKGTSVNKFAQMKCSCGKECSLVDGFTSCCGKSLNDVLFDVFDEMYFDRRKSFAMKFEDTNLPLFFVGSASSESDLSTIDDT